MQRRALGPISNLPTPLLPHCLLPCAVICWSNPLSRAASSQILWEVKGHTNRETFLGSHAHAFYSFFNLEETELRHVVFPSSDSSSSKAEHAEDGSERTVSSNYICINKKNRTSSTARALTASACEWLHTLLSPVRACLWCDVCIGSPLTRSSAIMRAAVCCVRWGGISPRVGLIGIKRAALKSHRRLEMLSETGTLLLGDFRQLLDSVCPCLFHCLPQYPSLLKSLITPQFPSALFLSLSVAFQQ